MFDFPSCGYQQGWQCPVCKRVFSPSTPFCLWCGNGETQTVTNITFSPKETTTIRDIMTGKEKER